MFLIINECATLDEKFIMDENKILYLFIEYN